jgi:hypothetical protein
MLFASLTKLMNAKSDPSLRSLSTTYLQKIDLCNLGIYNDISDLNISPANSSDNNILSLSKCPSDLDIILDKTT